MAAANSELPIFVALYPRPQGEPAELTLELRRGNELLTRASPPLPPATGGRIAWIGTLPLASLRPGSYQLAATARQGAEEVRESSSFEALSPPVAGP